MNFTDFKCITISCLNFQDLLARRTNNPIAEDEIPAMLREAIKHGTEVILTDTFGRDSLELVLNGEKFEYKERH